MKLIYLTQKKVAVVDDENYKELNKYKWCAITRRGLWYAQRKDKNNKTVLMHHQITNFRHKKIAHLNQDGLDNRKHNLKRCSHSQSMVHRKKNSNNTSGLRGVYWNKTKRRWVAYIQKDNVQRMIGSFRKKIAAGVARDIKANELFGEFAVLNFPREQR